MDSAPSATAEDAAKDEVPAEVDPARPFTRARGLKAGLSAKTLRGPRFRSVFHGVYLAAHVELTPALRAEAALVPFPASAFCSHSSAARIHDVPIPTLPDEHVTVLQACDRRSRPGTVCHLLSVATIVVRDGIRVSAYRQMFVELAELLSLVDLVVVGDHLVRNRNVKLADLVEFCTKSTLPGAAAASVAASYVRERVDSPMETRLRMLLVLAGLPEPRVNITITDALGQPVRRYDLSYPAAKVAVEYDGRHHVEREEQWEADLARREAIDDDEWRILVVTSKGIFNHPDKTLQRVVRLLRRRGHPGLPARVSDDWRPHFPGRN